MEQIKSKVELDLGVLETKEGTKSFKRRGFLMRQYNDKLSRLNENKRILQQLENTERLADKYDFDYGEFIDHFFTQKKRFEKRSFYLKQEAEEIKKEIEEHDNLLKGER